jgi:hypothetical protein
MTIRIEYHWVPESRRIKMPKAPKRVQTVMSHSKYDIYTGEKLGVVDAYDPTVVPVLRSDADLSDPIHLKEVFYEDHLHDWHWDSDGVLRYFSRAMNHSTWIRCEFEEL